MRKGKFFKLVRVKFGKQVYELKKKWKTNVWYLDLGEKIAKLFLSKNVYLPPKDAKIRVIQVGQGQLWKINQWKKNISAFRLILQLFSVGWLT